LGGRDDSDPSQVLALSGGGKGRETNSRTWVMMAENIGEPLPWSLGETTGWGSIEEGKWGRN